jgi:glycosyltransferase involved in cell wall biosynthesis
MKRVLYLQYTNPAGYPPLEHSSRILAEAGWDVLFLGTGATGADALRFPEHPRIEVRQLKFCPAGWQQKLHYIGFCLWAIAWTMRWRPRWIYASDMLACPPAFLLSLLPGMSLLYHEHDSPAEITGQAKLSGFLRFCLWARAACARRAAVCVLPNRQRAEHFAKTLEPAHPVEVVWNCPRVNEVAPARDDVESAELRLFYHGSIVQDRLPITVIDALALLPGGVSLTVAGYETVGSRGYVDQLRQRARQLGIEDRFHYVGALSLRDDLLRVCRSCDVGLALLPMQAADLNLTAMTGASNKPFDYLANGLAVLVSDLPDWRAMFVEPGYGWSCDPSDADSIAASIRRFLDDPGERRRMAEAGRRRILSDWNYERQFQPVFDRLEIRKGRLLRGQAAVPGLQARVPAQRTHSQDMRGQWK